MHVNMRLLGEKEDPRAGGARMIINPGSVGQPRDGDPRASYMVLELPDELPSGPWHGSLTFRRVAYPIEQTQALMRDLQFPAKRRC